MHFIQLTPHIFDSFLENRPVFRRIARPVHENQVREVRRSDTDFRRFGFPEQDKIAVRPGTVEQFIVNERPESHCAQPRGEIEHDVRVRLHHDFQFVLGKRFYASKKSRLHFHGILLRFEAMQQ